MGYSVKWIAENLGITRDMLRYYEKEGLISRDKSRNTVNNYRDYSDKDIEVLWGIKLLIGIGFTAKEILAFMHDPNFDFDIALEQKVIELESQYEEKRVYLEFAKTIKLTGRLPTASKLGSIRFKDFLAYTLENWNLYTDPRTAPIIKASELLRSKAPQELTPEDAEQIVDAFTNLEFAQAMFVYSMHGYFQVISDMKDFGYSSNMVQRVVRLLHEFMISHNPEPEYDDKIVDKQFLALYVCSYFLYGDVSKSFKELYGKDGCLFIAKALTYYGGFDENDL